MLTRQSAHGYNSHKQDVMGTSWARAALLLLMMTFFAGLAMDIAVPAVVMSVMALSVTLAQSGLPVRRGKEQTA